MKVLLINGIDAFGISLFSGIISFGVMFLIKLFGDFIFKTESMGGGDIKLLFFLGFILGWPQALLSIFLGSIIGLPISLIVLKIKNTNIINGADGLASVVGATEACWIHDNYVSGDGLLKDSCWSLGLENGWAGMRGTIIERNIFRKYGYSGSYDYRGPDTGVLALASGYNTFVISNYLGAIQQSNYNVANTHIINNVVHSMYSSFSNGKPNDIRPKISAHTYYNILGQISNEISSNGVNYYYQNTIIPTVNLW